MDDAPFAYSGPPGLRETARLALSWIRNPETGRNLLEEGRVRRVRLGPRQAVVHLALPDSPAGRLMAEDAQCELFDHFHGRWPVVVIPAW